MNNNEWLEKLRDYSHSLDELDVRFGNSNDDEWCILLDSKTEYFVDRNFYPTKFSALVAAKKQIEDMLEEQEKKILLDGK